MMDILNVVFPIIMMCVFVMMFYSIVRWLMVMASDRKNTDKRKKYARMCLICMLIIVAALFIGFVISFKRNTM